MMTDKLSDNWQTPADLFNVLNKGGEYMGITFEGWHFDIDLCATKENSKCNIYGDDYLNDCYSCKEDNTDMLGFPIEKLGLEMQIWQHKFSTKWPQIRTAFLNPPYSNPKPFIEKAWEDSRYCRIVLLVKCDPSTKWWATFWNYGYKDLDCHICQRCKGRGRYTWWQGTCPFDEDPCDICDGAGFTSRSYKIKSQAGPKPGCEIILFPKRIKFSPPQQLIDDGSVYKIRNRWVQKCKNTDCVDGVDIENFHQKCGSCKGKGYTTLSGPTFPCALIIMDRRNV